jgi:ATP-binding cassette subfamily B protein
VGLLGLGDELQHGLLSLYRLSDLLEAQPEQGPGKRAIRVPRLSGHIEFLDVSFRYDADGKDVLSHIELRIQPGQTVALVGRPGGGKTTFTMLLQRFLSPTEGKILLDGRDASSIELRSLREHIGIVTSETPIVQGSVHENIALANPAAPLDRVAEAAKLAQADGFIRTLPRGYQTVIGARGIALSPSQRQRIGLARTLLKDPQILVLDEIAATLDPESQQAIEANLPAILHNRTAIVIPYRRTTVPSADNIIVLDEGRIVETGTHRELLERKGLYYYLGRLNGSPMDDC